MNKKLKDFLIGNESVRAKRNDLASKEELTFGQIAGILLIIVIWFFAIMRGSTTSQYTALVISFLIAMVIVRFNK